MAQEVYGEEEDIPFPIEWGGTGSTESQSDAIMPDWFKNNAKWWKEGLIDDTDMINALENLMAQDVIPLDRFVKSTSELEYQSSVPKGIPSEIPSYQKDVFGFWSEGIISDEEVVNSIGHLMGEGIISSERIQKEITERKEKQIDPPSLQLDASHKMLDNQCFPGCSPCFCEEGIETAQLVFETATQNLVSMTYLQKIKHAEHELIKDACDMATNDYSDNKNQDSMNFMTSNCNAEKTAKEDSQRALEIHTKAVQLTKQAQDNAVNSGLNLYDLEKKVSDKQSEIDSIKNIKTESEINSAYKEAQKSQILANQGMQNTLLSAISDNVRHQLTFESNAAVDLEGIILQGIGEIEYSDFVISEPSKQATNDDDLYFPPGLNDRQKAYTPLGSIGFMLETISPESLAVINNPDYDLLDEEYKPKPTNPYNSVVPSSSDDSNNFFVILGANYDPKDPIFDQLDSSSGVDKANNEFDLYWITITLPAGNVIEIGQALSEGTLSKTLDKDILEGHKLLNEKSEYCIFCGESTVTAPGENCIYCGEIDEPAHVTPETSSESDSCPSSCSGVNSGENCILCGEVNESEHEITVSGGDEYVSEYSGGETTTYPDGTTMTTYPDGRIEYLHPDGAIEIKLAGGGEEIYLPDGTIQLISLDSTVTTTYPDGTITIMDEFRNTKTILPDGTITMEYSDGTIETISPSDESTVNSNDVFVGTSITDSEGTIITTYPDGTTHSLFDSGISYTLYSDGTSYQRFPHNESTRTLYPDGTFYTLYPDGTVYSDNWQEYESGTGQVYVSELINYEYGNYQVQVGGIIHYFNTQTEMDDAIPDLVEQYKASG